MPYDFTSDGFRQFSDGVLNAEGDQATLTALLADLQNTWTDQIGISLSQEKEVEAIKAENERLKATNMEFYQRLGEEARKRNNEPAKQPEEEEEEISTEAYMEKVLNKMFEK